MIRLRYSKNDLGNLFLKEPVVAKDDLLTVEINTKELKANIYSVNESSKFVLEVTAKTHYKLKSEVKKQLQNLGVVFDAEVRPGRVLKMGDKVI